MNTGVSPHREMLSRWDNCHNCILAPGQLLSLFPVEDWHREANQYIPSGVTESVLYKCQSKHLWLTGKNVWGGAVLGYLIGLSLTYVSVFRIGWCNSNRFALEPTVEPVLSKHSWEITIALASDRCSLNTLVNYFGIIICWKFQGVCSMQVIAEYRVCLKYIWPYGD